VDHADTSIKSVRITVGILSLALFGQTAFWLLHDIADRGAAGAWSVWASGSGMGLSATSSLDLGLGVLQLAAGWATLIQARTAGGLLLASSATTLLFRLPAVWYVLLDSPSDPWFGDAKGPSLGAVGGSAIGAVVTALVLTALLFLVRHLENETSSPYVLRGAGPRPVKVTATTSGVLLGALNIFYIGRNVNTAFQVGPNALAHLLAGKGAVRAELGVASAWQWASLTVLCGLGMLFAFRRRPVAKGFSLGLALFMVPPDIAEVSDYVSTGVLFKVSVDTAQTFLELLGSAAVIALLAADTARDRRDRRRPEDPPAAPAPLVAPVPADARLATTADSG
jgi:hypothetical protein